MDNGQILGKCADNDAPCDEDADCNLGVTCDFYGLCSSGGYNPCYHDSDCDGGAVCVDKWLVRGGQVSGAGASLFVNFFLEPNNTNDWIDPDHDQFWGYHPSGVPGYVDRLAAPWNPTLGFLDTWWMFQYRSLGSVNGFNEFVNNQLLGTIGTSVPSEAGVFNGYRYANLGAIQWGGPYANPSGTPFEPCEIEFAFLDVPSAWAVKGPGLEVPELPTGHPGHWWHWRHYFAEWWRSTPLSDTYGYNAIPSSTGFEAQFDDLGRDSNGDGIDDVFLNTNIDDPDEDTIYDYTAAWVPVAIIANRGTGVDQLRYTQAQYLFLTGRMPSGENLVAATRDFGSGTRNAAMNTMGIDPTWGRGDNVGNTIGAEALAYIGPTHQASNCGGSGIMEAAVQHRRLAVGYTGVCGSSRAAQDAQNGRYEVVGMCKDIDNCGEPGCDCAANPCNRYCTQSGWSCTATADCDLVNFPGETCGAAHWGARPTVDKMLDNCDDCCGYQIAGAGSFVARGNRDANRPPMVCENDMRTPCDEAADCLPEPGGACVANPRYEAGQPIDNQTVADYLNNILDSTEDFVEELPPPLETNLMPGQWLARNFMLTNGVDCLHELDDPTCESDTLENTELQEYIRNNTTCNVYAYGYANKAGLVPRRTQLTGGAQYSDGSNYEYIYWNGTAYVKALQGIKLAERNKIQGDFDKSYSRTVNDATQLVTAMYTPRAWQQTAAAIGSGDVGNMAYDNAIPEVIGDFDGNGSFNKEDLRYWMDGLGLVSGKVNRKQGAINIDTAILALGQPLPWADPSDSLVIPPVLPVFPSATCPDPTFQVPAPISGLLATGKTYASGDFRGDVSGPQRNENWTAGAQPTGWDGRVDAHDIDYVCRSVGDWNDVDQAVFMDFSCDMTGDANVTSADVTELVQVILGTDYCDVDLDDAVTGFGAGTPPPAGTDAEIMWNTMNDAEGCNATGTCGWANGDMNCDGYVDFADWSRCTGGAATCPSNLTIVDAYPPDGAVDARVPHPATSTTPLKGMGMPGDPITIDLGTGNTGLAACFAVCQTVHESFNWLTDVTDNGDGSYDLTFAHGITAGAVTTVTYTGDGSYVSYIHHPANVDGSGFANAQDIVQVINRINVVFGGGSVPAWEADIDGSGAITVTDMVVLINLLNGSGLYDPWFGTSRPVNDGSCPAAQ